MIRGATGCFDILPLTRYDESIERPFLLILLDSTLSLPKRLRSRDLLRQSFHFGPGRFIIPIHYDIAHGRHLTRLDLEVPHTETFSRIDFHETTALIGIHLVGVWLQNLLWSDSTLQLAVRQVASSLDDGDTTDAFRRATQRALASNEEC